MKYGSNSGAAIAMIAVLFLASGGGGAESILEGTQMAYAAEVDRARSAETGASKKAQQSGVGEETGLSARTKRVSTSAAEGNAIRAAVESMLSAQAAAWNRGDIDAFMAHYWKSDALTFNSGGKTTRGWTETLNRYRERYPTREKMGRLHFSELETTPLGNSAALVLGNWNLERESEPVSGNFSLVLRKLDNRWRIIHDHTSRRID